MDKNHDYIRRILAKSQFTGNFQDEYPTAQIHALIDTVPAEDVQPVVHGRWVVFPGCLKYPNAYSDDHIVCSACEECFSVLDNCTERFDYCPHCGAKMDLEG